MCVFRWLFKLLKVVRCKVAVLEVVFSPLSVLINMYIKNIGPRALWQSCNMGVKVVNFGKWFLCQFSPKTQHFLHGPFLTPQTLGDVKVLTNLGMQREKKNKKSEGFHRQNRRKLHPKSEKNSFTNISPLFLDAAGWPNIHFISLLSLSIYLKYLDAGKVRGKVENSQWNANVTPPIETLPKCIGCSDKAYHHHVFLNLLSNYFGYDMQSHIGYIFGTSLCSASKHLLQNHIDCIC